MGSNAFAHRHQTSTTRSTILELLQRLGYSTVEFLLTPRQYGIPNSRLRYYLLARRTPFRSEYSVTVLREIPVPEHTPKQDISAKCISEFLDSSLDEDFMIPDRILERWGRLFDIVLPSAFNSCCFTRGRLLLTFRYKLTNP